jgi:hypothetical protein
MIATPDIVVTMFFAKPAISKPSTVKRVSEG